ncbi:hypothetical protein BJX63DRAFT_398886 [Aspergillus granulosus]|uniref:Uncharacterized protein n=1 Tax=Aspergillus granulosus TaxID=176169 RepID=A0ABR4H833_9EURO
MLCISETAQENSTSLIAVSRSPARMSSSCSRSEPSFVSGPNTQGTLVSTCSLTFGFCIWTVAHPSVIPQYQARLVSSATRMSVQ